VGLRLTFGNQCLVLIWYFKLVACMGLRPHSLVVVDTTLYIPFALTCFCDTFAHPVVTLRYPWSNFQSKVLPSELSSAQTLTGCSEEQYLPAWHVLSTPIDNMLNYPAQKQTDRYADKNTVPYNKAVRDNKTIQHTILSAYATSSRERVGWNATAVGRDERVGNEQTN